jgi:hypothetical protein
LHEFRIDWENLLARLRLGLLGECGIMNYELSKKEEE